MLLLLDLVFGSERNEGTAGVQCEGEVGAEDVPAGIEHNTLSQEHREFGGYA